MLYGLLYTLLVARVPGPRDLRVSRGAPQFVLEPQTAVVRAALHGCPPQEVPTVPLRVEPRAGTPRWVTVARKYVSMQVCVNVVRTCKLCELGLPRTETTPPLAQRPDPPHNSGCARLRAVKIQGQRCGCPCPPQGVCGCVCVCVARLFSLFSP